MGATRHGWLERGREREFCIYIPQQANRCSAVGELHHQLHPSDRGELLESFQIRCEWWRWSSWVWQVIVECELYGSNAANFWAGIHSFINLLTQNWGLCNTYTSGMGPPCPLKTYHGQYTPGKLLGRIWVPYRITQMSKSFPILLVNVVPTSLLWLQPSVTHSWHRTLQSRPSTS